MNLMIPPPTPKDQQSPFRPGFGSTPPVMVGRQPEVTAFARALDGPGSTGRTVFVTGQRGVGKTVLLNIFQEVADTRQWWTVREQASAGFVQRLTQARLPEVLESHDAHERSKSTVVGVTLPLGGGGLTVRSDTTNALVPDLRSHLMKVLELLDSHETGLLIALDEVHRSNLDEFRQMTDALAHAMSQDAPLAFVAAGLPASIDNIVNDDVSTFLRRADRINLAGLSSEETREALRAPVEQAGKRFAEEALEFGVALSQGYPYLVQIVGDLAWNAALDADEITRRHVEGIEGEARQVLGRQIHEPTLAALSPGARRYLRAMTLDDDISSTGEIADRLGLKKQTANDYRRQLIAHGVVEVPSFGHVRMVIPHLRDHLLDRDDE
ncbi:AAA ATPase-like protein [Brevibacterium sanguinis]|uniref:AAA ATPase-like protein n=2 Tax=Brevibacterium TaxID=1696 RepID=A0A366IFW9_9MICO|nr:MULTISPECIES: ATP-binding protein [Brevibacterium]RBP63623.1 AAA ATPase-like protein [Brevibacterium sanguinis]RBP70282.1 AAA ATPase-like protein [Brevibacterium celere]